MGTENLFGPANGSQSNHYKLFIMVEIKHYLIVPAVFILMASAVLAQELVQNPAASLELKIEQPGGRHGASVAYNPGAQLYYAVIAGNAEFPLETFASDGRNLKQSQAYSDMRGLWWNAKAGALEGNLFSDGGIVSIGLTSEGYAGTGNKQIFAGADYQPKEQSVGTFDPKKKEILYYLDGAVVGYARKDGSMTGTYLMLSLPVGQESINLTTLIFTGVKGMELGVLDVVSKKVYLFSRKDGSLTGTVNLPAGTLTYEKFNFSYANGHVFLFDQENRKWVGYRIFEF